ncbi:Ras-related protein [Trichinella pseudospiralis]
MEISCGCELRFQIYDMKSHGGQLGISADSGCMELTDMENAVIRLDIKIESNPAAQCIFPHWLVHKRGQVDAKKIWQSLTDDVFYKFYTNEMVAQDENDFNLTRSLCIETENYGIMDQFVLYSINDCEHGYQCMKIYKRNSKRIPFETLINTDQVKQKCPNQGLYRVEGCDEQESIVSFGCTEEHKLEIDMKCDEQHSKKYDCLGHWEQSDITYLVLKETTTGQTSCAVYSHNKDNVVNMSTVNRHSCRRTLMSEQENKQYITFRPSGICGSSASCFVIYSKWIIVCLLVNHLFCNFDYGRKNHCCVEKRST